jgi:hypothetical protein
VTSSPLPLPPFEADHVARMVAAQDAGDPVRAEQIRRHLVDEGATNPHESAVLESVTRASLLAKQMLDASDRASASVPALCSASAWSICSAWAGTGRGTRPDPPR